MVFRLFIPFLTLFVFCSSYGQLSDEQKLKVDSLELIVKQEVNDTVIIKSKLELNRLIRFQDPQMSLNQAYQLDSLCDFLLHYKSNLEVLRTVAEYQLDNLHLISRINANSGNYKAAVSSLKKALKISKKLGDPVSEASALNSLGSMYQYQGKYDTAVQYYINSIELSEKHNLQSNLGDAYISMGNIHRAQGDFEKTQLYTNKALECFEEAKYEEGKAVAYNNLASSMRQQNKPLEALNYYIMANEIFAKVENYEGLATSANNIGTIYHVQGELDNALIYYNQAIEYAKKLGDLKLVATAMNNIAHIEKAKGNHKKAISINEEALEIAQKSNHIIVQRNVTGGHYLILEKAGDYKTALEYYIKYRDIEDSINSVENRNEILAREIQYEFDKERYADSVAHEKEKQISKLTHEQELYQQKQQRWLMFGGMTLALILGGFIYNRLRLTRKQKEIIESAHHELAEKNQEITDSINYAKRIQSAILPPDKFFKDALPNSFVLYKPKDIVAGDFYWLEKVEDTIYFAAADCTGHGVPGAMVSVICNNGLNRSVREFGLRDPGKILDKTRELVMKEFEKSEEEVKDGMDIALCKLSMKPNGYAELKFAGAHNPLWVIRAGGSEVEEIKGDKQPIGKFDQPIPFTTHDMDLFKGDLVYIFSDGFADQFGGEKGKKFKIKNLKKLLTSVSNETPQKQKELIDQAFEDWKNGYDQLDDVCVIGVRL